MQCQLEPDEPQQRARKRPQFVGCQVGLLTQKITTRPSPGTDLEFMVHLVDVLVKPAIVQQAVGVVEQHLLLVVCIAPQATSVRSPWRSTSTPLAHTNLCEQEHDKVAPNDRQAWQVIDADAHAAPLVHPCASQHEWNVHQQLKARKEGLLSVLLRI